MNRFDIINNLIVEHGFKTYLEIGTQQSVSGHAVKIKTKVGVDPSPMKRVDGDYNNFQQVTSDEFFAKNKRKFDIIFIDGDHSYKQSRKDFVNAMNCLRKGGVIVMHDCLPHCEEYTSLLWNGEVFKTLADIHFSGLEYIVYNHDHGCAVIPKQSITGLIENDSFAYSDFLQTLFNLHD